MTAMRTPFPVPFAKASRASSNLIGLEAVPSAGSILWQFRAVDNQLGL